MRIRVNGQTLRRNVWPFLFLLPYIAALTVFGIGPALYAAGTSLVQPASGGAADGIALGLANYVAAVGDLRFLPAIAHVAAYLVLWLPASALTVVTLALILEARGGRMAATARLAYFIPSAVTGSVSVLMWLFMLDPEISPFAPILRAFGLDSLSSVLRTDHLPWVFAIMGFTATVGFWTVVIHGALVDVPRNLIEAARIDGANGFALARLVQLPLIRRYLAFMLIVCVAEGSQLFTEPATAAQATAGSLVRTWSINQLAYDQAFRAGHFGPAAAIAVILLGVALAATAIVVRMMDLLSEAD